MKHLKTIAALLIGLLLLPYHLLIPDAHADFYIAVSQLNVREGPGTDYTDLYTLPYGERIPDTGNVVGLWVEIQTEVRNSHHYIAADGTPVTEYSEPLLGYMYLPHLSMEPPGDARVAVIEAPGEVNIRETPGGKVLGKAQPGDEVTVLSAVEVGGVGWCKVRFRDGHGFVMSEYIGK